MQIAWCACSYVVVVDIFIVAVNRKAAAAAAAYHTERIHESFRLVQSGLQRIIAGSVNSCILSFAVGTTDVRISVGSRTTSSTVVSVRHDMVVTRKPKILQLHAAGSQQREW